MEPEIKDHVAIIRIDHPPANAWDLATMNTFSRAIEQVASDPVAIKNYIQHFRQCWQGD